MNWAIWLQSNRLTAVKKVYIRLTINFIFSSEQYMIHGNVININTPIFVRNDPVLKTSSAKFLGIAIDKLNFNHYISSVLGKVGSVSGLDKKYCAPNNIAPYVPILGLVSTYGILT